MKPYYENENGRLYHGDCLEILPQLESVDLVLTDPPYGVNRDKGFGGFGGFRTPIKRNNYDDTWDDERPSKECLIKIISMSRISLIFGGNYFADILLLSTHWIVWDKKNTMPTFGDAELIWTDSKRKSVKIVECEYNGLIGKEGKRLHPTQKPTKLIINLIETYKPNRTVFDPFLGSGTTAVACERLKRKWIGIEIEEKYCEIAVKRIEHEREQLKLF